VALTILHGSVRTLVDGKELAEDLLGKNTFGVLSCVVREQTTEEEVASVTADHASDGPIIEVWVVGDAVLPATGSLVGQQIHGEDAVLIGTIVEVAEKRHVHCPSIASHVKVIARER